MSIVLIAGTPIASACPKGSACVVAETRASGSEVASTPNAADRSVSLVPRPHAEPSRPLSLALRAPVARRSAFEMPWIWRVLRHEVYRRLPRHEDARFTLSLSPVVVGGTFDTVPGVGVAGDF